MKVLKKECPTSPSCSTKKMGLPNERKLTPTN
jgi:hypothetical protein